METTTVSRGAPKLGPSIAALLMLALMSCVSVAKPLPCDTDTECEELNGPPDALDYCASPAGLDADECGEE